jgi:hypothetical protein
MKKTVMGFFLVLLIIMDGCGVHGIANMENTNEMKYISSNKYPAHTQKIFITKETLPAAVKYEVLATIDVGKITYGSVTDIEKTMAQETRSIGGDAIIELKVWFKPAAWAWAAPQGSGKIVKILDHAGVDFSSMHGYWF